VLEALAALLECFSYRTHPLGDHPHRLSDSIVWAGGYIPGQGWLEARQLEWIGARCSVGYNHAVCNRPPTGFIPPLDLGPGHQVR
jgi:hypothetical protein